MLATRVPKMVYTQYKRHHEAKETLPLASNAIIGRHKETWAAVDSSMKDGSGAFGTMPDTFDHDSKSNSTSDHLKPSSDSKSRSRSRSRSSVSSEQLDALLLTGLSTPIAILPQYITTTAITITIAEASLPHLSSNFAVTTSPYRPSAENPTHPPVSGSDAKPLLIVHRDRPSYSHRHLITTPDDIHCHAPLLYVRRRANQIPRTYSLTDPTETRIGDVQGDFTAPFSGSKATIIFTNACTNRPTRLSMRGSWHNRHALVRDEETDEVVASMSSEVWTLQNTVGGRRSYDVHVRAGVDIVAVVAMVVALDDRFE